MTTQTRTEWEAEKAALETRLEPFTREAADGKREIIPHPAVRSLRETYARIIERGLTRGWLRLTDAGQAVAA